MPPLTFSESRYLSGAGDDAITFMNVGQNCYEIDSRTVGLTNGYATGSPRPLMGEILRVDADGGVWVHTMTVRVDSDSFDKAGAASRAQQLNVR